jgi:uncharacterized protein (TIGR02246 family)
MPYSKQNSPDSIPQIFTEAWNKRDAYKIAQLFEENAEFVNVTGLWWHNRKDIEQAHAYGLSTIFKNSSLQLIRTKVKYLSESIAVMQAKMKLSGQTPIGSVKTPGERQTLFTFVVHKVGEQWLCASAQNTDIVPHQETHVRNENGQLIAVNYQKEHE